jgi:hypothetical protein
MPVERANFKPGFLNTMRSVIVQGAPVTAELRRGFLERPFWKQAVCIGKYAKIQLELANKIISNCMAMNIEPRIETPRAVNVWKRIVENNDPLVYSEKIKHLFPSLANESSKIEQIFSSTYTFWVKNFYSCNANGGLNVESYKISMALRFGPDEIRSINKKSGMPYLGQYMKDYAHYLLDARNFRDLS